MSASATLSTIHLEDRIPDEPPRPRPNIRDTSLTNLSSRRAAKRTSPRPAQSMRVLVVFEDSYCAYRDAISSAIRTLRPQAEVTTAQPSALEAKVARLQPHLVVCSQPNPLDRDSAAAWVEIPYDTGHPATIYLAGEYSETANPTLDELISIFDEVGKLTLMSRSARGGSRCV